LSPFEEKSNRKEKYLMMSSRVLFRLAATSGVLKKVENVKKARKKSHNGENRMKWKKSEMTRTFLGEFA
jgi:hypothetical protein